MEQAIVDAAYALRDWAITHHIKDVQPLAGAPNQKPYIWDRRIYPVAIRFSGKMALIGDKTFGGIAYQHWDGNQRYTISLPEYDAAAYHRLRKFVWMQQGFDPDALINTVYRDPQRYWFTVDGMYNPVTPEFANMHPFGQRWLGLWEWDMPFQSPAWNQIHSVDWGAHRGEPRKYKQRSFYVEAV